MILNLEIPGLVSILITLATLLIASYYDVKTREIAEFLWIPALVISAILTYLTVKPNTLVIIFSLIPALLLLIFMLFGLIGGADFLAMLLIGISTPYLNVLPISLLTLLYSLLIPSAMIIYNFAVNVVRYWDAYLMLDCGTASKWVLLFLGRPMKVSSFIKSNFLYPLTVPRCHLDDYDVICRTSFDINEDFKENINHVNICLSKGYLKYDDYIWVTPALPHVFFITIGYLLALITPEELIYSVFKVLLGI